MRGIGLPILTLALLAAGLTGCSKGARHCEHDATDTVVSDSFCEHNTPGYEWEYDSGSKTKKKTTKVKVKTGTKTKTRK